MMGVLEDFNAAMRNVAQMQAGRGQRMAESGRGTREALAMLQAQFNQIGGSFREMGEARRGREHETGLLDKQLKEGGYQASVAQRSAERIAGLAQRGAGERLDITEESATARHKETERNRLLAAKIAAGRMDTMTPAEMYDWAKLQVTEDNAENMFDLEWRKTNAEELAGQFREHFLYLNPGADLADVERATERFKRSLLTGQEKETVIEQMGIESEIKGAVADEPAKLVDLIRRYHDTLQAFKPAESMIRGAEWETPTFAGLMSLGTEGGLAGGLFGTQEMSKEKEEVAGLLERAEDATQLNTLRTILTRLKEIAASMGAPDVEELSKREEYQRAKGAIVR